MDTVGAVICPLPNGCGVRAVGAAGSGADPSQDLGKVSSVVWQPPRRVCASWFRPGVVMYPQGTALSRSGRLVLKVVHFCATCPS